jgi:hypothetical protein
MAVGVGWGGSARGDVPGATEYRRFVQPLLAERCLGCHSQAVVGEQEAGVDGQSFRADRLAAGPAGEVDRQWITPGDPDASEVWRRVTSTDADLRMPPPEHGSALSADELARLQRWIEEGAVAEPFWADESPQASLARKPASAKHPSSDAARDPVIDVLLERAWKDAGAAPAKESSPEAWLRRATFTLTGLPPTIEELDRFLADDSADARERAVDRLLASPRFGERMAALWLDAARYADTHGYHADAHRDQWRWRDWVIDAFNANLPYDRFVLDQIAGDLAGEAPMKEDALGDAADRRLATGFLRNHMINFENGAFAEEYRAEYVADRVHAVSQALLGTTLSCARCHDHPYDPITTEQYFQFFAFFNSIDEQGLDGDRGNAAPAAPAPTREQRGRLAELEGALAEIDRVLQDREDDFVQGQRVWERRTRAEGSFVATPTGAIVRLTFDDGTLEELGQAKPGRPPLDVLGSPLLLPGAEGGELLVDGKSHVACALPRPLDISEGASVCGALQFTSDEEATLWEFGGADASGSPTHRLRLVAFPRTQRLRLVLLEGAEERAELLWKLSFERNVWTRLAVRFGGSDEDAAIEAFAGGRALSLIPSEEKDEASKEGVQQAQPKLATLELPQLRGIGFSRFSFGGAEEASGVAGILDDAAVFGRPLTLAELDAAAGGNAITDALAVDEAARTEPQTRSLADWYRRNVDPIARDLLKRRDEAAADVAAANAAIPHAMVARDLPQPRPTHVLLRGRYDSPAKLVSPRSLDFGSFSGEVSRPDRLGLAENLIRPDHPRTARVAVDRLWRICFGQGLIATPEDFGLRGQPPLHREALDRLSVEFVESGWDVKALLRRIVLSRAFALSDDGPPATWSADPDNRLFARFPARRLEAEMVVDRPRFVAGTLQERIGGRSVFGFEPGDRWKDLSYSPGDFTAQIYRSGVGEDLYRRALYTFWKRASPPVTLSLFDVSQRETCQLVRGEQRTALQALATLNDPTALDAYRSLGCSLADEQSRPEEDRLVELFRSATSRSPSTAEVAALTRELASFCEALAANPADVEATLAGGFEPLPEPARTAERAAWSLMATLVMNLPEASEY